MLRLPPRQNRVPVLELNENLAIHPSSIILNSPIFHPYVLPQGQNSNIEQLTRRAAKETAPGTDCTEPDAILP